MEPEAVPRQATRTKPLSNHRWIGGSFLTLLVVIVAFAALYSALSYLRFTEFYAGNWDLGVNMQAAWTTTHGYLAYESGDYISVQSKSFLFIHPTYLMFPVAWVYFSAPYATTLFAIQSGVLASSALPLYLLGRQSRTTPWILLVGVGVYLCSLPVLSGFLFDFHWEAFLPAELLWTFYLWSRNRCWWAAIPTTAGILTLEVFPVLLVGVVAYFAWPFLRSYVRAPRENLRYLWRTLKGPARPLVGLTLLAVFGFAGTALVARYALPSLVGGSPIFPSSGPRSYFGFLYWGFDISSLGDRFAYWFVLFASFGFLPLLYRHRLLILSVPWAFYTIFMTPDPAFTTLGFQYSLITIAPLAIGFIEGLGRITRTPSPGTRDLVPGTAWFFLFLPFAAISVFWPLTFVRPSAWSLWLELALGAWFFAGVLGLRYAFRDRHSQGRTVGRRWLASCKRGKIARASLVAAIVILVGCNIALSPLNPANFLGPGQASYSFTYVSSPSYSHISSLIDRIPSGASVITSDNLFPFVANNPHAFSLLWYPADLPYLPFNGSHLPEYVLLSTSQWYVPDFLNSVLYQESDYGLASLLYSSIAYPGTIYLFELGYHGPTHVVEVTPFPSRVVLCGHDLAIGRSGVVVRETGTRCGTVVESRPTANLSGNNPTIWYGPYSTLLPGEYTVTVSVRGNLSGPGPSDAAILVMNANALGTPYWYDVAIQANQVSSTQWTEFTYHFNLTESHPQAEWRGYVAGATVDGRFVPGYSELNFIEIDYSPVPA